MNKIPLLFYSDNPAQPSGLGRITKDLAVLSSQLPELMIGTFGMGGTASRKLPFAQYTFPQVEEQWGASYLEDVWNDFAGSKPGVIFTIWDPSRLTWLANPMMGGKLQDFLTSGRFQRWGYFPVDSHGIHGRLTGQCAEAIARYDRVLGYTIFGSEILSNSIGREVDWIPHGYNEKVFQPREKAPGRMTLNVAMEDTVIGMVGTNQSRKDWGVAFEAMALLHQKLPSLKFWVHTDTLERYWSIPALIQDFGIGNITRVTFSSQFNSEQLSYLYSTCDCTFLVSSEGFGFPLVESLACGVPAVHSTYGGGSELIPDQAWLVKPTMLRLDTQWNIFRPVFTPEDWVTALRTALNQAADGSMVDVCTNAVSHLQWKNLWGAAWKKFFLEGLQ